MARGVRYIDKTYLILIINTSTLVENVDIDKDNLENINIDIHIDIDIDIDKDILGKKSIISAEIRVFSCFFDEISISIVDISAFFEISMKYRHLF